MHPVELTTGGEVIILCTTLYLTLVIIYSEFTGARESDLTAGGQVESTIYLSSCLVPALFLPQVREKAAESPQ
jgi:hypothetical protein